MFIISNIIKLRYKVCIILLNKFSSFVFFLKNMFVVVFMIFEGLILFYLFGK